MTQQGRLQGELFDECAEWIWEQLNEEGFQLAGELIDLILKTERELAIHDRSLDEISTLIVDEFRMRGIEGKPQPIEPALIKAVLQWEDEFLGFAGIARSES